MVDAVFYQKAISADEILDGICQHLPESNITPNDVRDAIITSLAGSMVYFPRYLRHRKRDAAILDAWDGTNTIAIANLHRISRSQVYRIVERAKIVASFKRLRDTEPVNLRT
jgi:Mor family transcriptional regulator